MRRGTYIDSLEREHSRLEKGLRRLPCGRVNDGKFAGCRCGMGVLGLACIRIGYAHAYLGNLADSSVGTREERQETTR